MSTIRFAGDDYARFERASRLLLSPLSNAVLDDWRAPVAAAVREFLGAD